MHAVKPPASLRLRGFRLSTAQQRRQVGLASQTGRSIPDQRHTGLFRPAVAAEISNNNWGVF